jgi:hypothetical protein
MANCRQGVAPVRWREQFGFDHSGPVGQRQEFHRFAGDLMMRALLDDEAAGRNDLPDKFTETIYGAVSVPSHVAEQFERMGADGEAEQVGYGQRGSTWKPASSVVRILVK